MKKYISPFYLIIQDNDKREFNILGPLSDDRPYIELVLTAQNSKRDVQCYSAAEGKSKEDIMAELQSSTFNYKYVQKQLV